MQFTSIVLAVLGLSATSVLAKKHTTVVVAAAATKTVVVTANAPAATAAIEADE
ncbi:hypothetical protein NX059_009898 [Plenodomus lindquistii]|nr:hypothetical protein NX059_009898 [Plenodomus lindquistii]